MIQRTVLLFVIALVGCGPIEQTPGLRLGGTESEIPTSFDFVSEHPLIQLEARGAVLRRVVNLWGVGLGDAMYVWTSPDTGWGQRVAKRPDVRVRVGDRTYSLRVARVEDAAETKRVFDAYAKKYGEDLDAIFGRPATVADFDFLYRLSARS